MPRVAVWTDRSIHKIETNLKLPISKSSDPNWLENLVHDINAGVGTDFVVAKKNNYTCTIEYMTTTSAGYFAKVFESA